MITHTFTTSDTYPVAILIKAASYNVGEMTAAYKSYLQKFGIPESEIIFVSLPYEKANKVSVKFIKATLATVLPELNSIGVKYLYCADAAYFKQLTKAKKAEAHLGYLMRCEVKDYDHMDVILGINHKSMFYNPANEPKLTMSLDTLLSAYKGQYTELGAGIIHNSEYPESYDQIKAFLASLHQYPYLSCDIEAFSLDFDKAGVGTITFAWDHHSGGAFAVDYAEAIPNDEGHFGRYEPNLAVRALLKEFFETYKGRLRFHKSTYDVKVMVYVLWMKDYLDNEGLLTGLGHLTRSFDDTKVIAYLATNTTAGNSLSLKDLAHEFAGNWANSEIKDIRKIPLPKLLQYNLIDGLATNYVYDKYYPIMVNDNQLDLYDGLFLESQIVITQIELSGMPLDPVAVAAARVELQGIVDKALESLYEPSSGPEQNAIELFTERFQREAMEAANEKLKVKVHPLSHFSGLKFNPNSNPQKQVLLYDIMGLPVIDLTDTKQPACGGDTLVKLRNHTKNPEYLRILDALLEFSLADKILTTFIPAFEAAIDKGDGVVWLHGCFNLGGTKSGRLSSSDPNLQNIPAKSKYAKLIKKCFRAPDGWLFCGADFNSLEDYISALTTRDPNKLKVYSGLKQYDVTINGSTHRITEECVVRYDGLNITGAQLYEKLRSSEPRAVHVV